VWCEIDSDRQAAIELSNGKKAIVYPITLSRRSDSGIPMEVLAQQVMDRL
jgi:hypothetical protein